MLKAGFIYKTLQVGKDSPTKVSRYVCFRNVNVDDIDSIKSSKQMNLAIS